MADLLRALEKKYEGDIATAKANIEVFQSNPAGIGEHPDVVGAMDMEVTKLADAQDKLDAVKKLLHPSAPKHLVE
tara:strand:- start:12092 stop:12316 length:225 start_codon:yes stop_codon:yes gene_type:complete